MAKSKSSPAKGAKGAGVRTPPKSDATASLIGQVGLGEIRPSPLNPRKTFPDESLESLAASIAEQGLLQPLVVRPIGTHKPAELVGGKWAHLSHFELIAGERRFRALQLLAERDRLPSDRVPVNVRWLGDAEALAAMLVENDQREDVRPSEQAAGYAKLLAELGTLSAVIERTGKSMAFVRQALALAKLPAWALAAVDAGELKRETAALVARVPGARSRMLAAACVLQGATNPEWLVGTPERPDLTGDHFVPLGYRDTKELIRTHFQIELKGAPFDRKALYVLPGCEPGHERSMPACEPCPSRAGNDPEATAEDVRADVCLDPECYRAKCEAHRAKEIEKAAKAKVPPAPDGFEWRGPVDRVPDGWLDPKVPLSECREIYDACMFREGEEVHAAKPLAEMLNKLLPQQYLAFDPKGKPRRLVRTKDVRDALGDLGLLKPKAKPAAKGAKAAQPSGPGDWEIDERAALLAAKALAEYAEDQCEALNPLPDAEMDWPIRDALTYAVRCIGHHMLTRCSFTTRRAVAAVLGVEEAKAEECVEKTVFDFEPAKLLGLLVAFSAVKELGANGSERNAGQDLLAWGELDWEQLQEQARRELSGGEPAEAKVAKAEREQIADECPVPVGSVIRTNYGTGPFVVLQVSKHGEWWSLSLVAQGSGKKTPHAWINEVRREADGRITSLEGKDELRVLPPGTDGGPTMHAWNGNRTNASDPNWKSLVALWFKGEPHPNVAADDKVIDDVFRGGTLLADVPDFPAEVREHLLIAHTVDRVEQVMAKLEEIKAQRGRQNATIYDALKAFGVSIDHGVYAAGDAIVDHLASIEAEPKPAKSKGKVKK